MLVDPVLQGNSNTLSIAPSCHNIALILWLVRLARVGGEAGDAGSGSEQKRRRHRSASRVADRGILHSNRALNLRLDPHLQGDVRRRGVAYPTADRGVK